MKKAFYELSDIQLVGAHRDAPAKNVQIICPVCGSSRCFLSLEKGVFHCWPNGHSGILKEYMKDAGKKRKKDSKSTDEIPYTPEDYKEIDEDTKSRAYPIYSATQTFPDGRPVFNAVQVAVQNYLKALGISQEVAVAMGLQCGTFSTSDRNGKSADHPCLVYTYRLFGKAVGLKVRTVDLLNDGSYRKEWQHLTPNKPSAPFNIDSVNPWRENADAQDPQVIITEGEKDVMTLLACGFHQVLSMPAGADSDVKAVFEAFEDWLPDRIVICGDKDHAGKKMVRHLCSHFSGRCARANLPMGYKDISEVYRDFGAETVRQVIADAVFEGDPEIVHVADLKGEILDMLDGHYDRGYDIGYGPLTDKRFRLTSDGGLIVVTGEPNSGKTDWLRCTLAKLMLQREKKAVFLSFEEPDKRKQIYQLAKLAFCNCRTEIIPEEMRRKFLERLDRCLINLDLKQSPATPRNILALCEKIRKRDFSMDFLVVDPYLFLVSEAKADTETQQIKQILTTFQDWGRKNRIWVIIVAHPRKLLKDGGRYEEVDEYTVSGSAHWANLADYLLSVRRIFADPSKYQGSEDPSYTLVYVRKVRDQSICQKGKLYFLRQPNGRYEERASEEDCRIELAGGEKFRDTEVW